MVSDNLNKDKNIRLIKNKNTNAVKKALKKTNKQAGERLIMSFTKKILMKTELNAICMKVGLIKIVPILKGLIFFINMCCNVCMFKIKNNL